MKLYKSGEFLSNFRMSNPSVQKLPIKPPYWRLSGDGSAFNCKCWKNWHETHRKNLNCKNNFLYYNLKFHLQFFLAMLSKLASRRFSISWPWSLHTVHARAVASGGAVVPGPSFEICAAPFHRWPSGCCIHPIQYFKNVLPLLVFASSCC